MRLSELWSKLAIAADRPAHQRVDETHPADLYAVVDAGGERGLMLLDDVEPPVPPHYDMLELTRSRRSDGRWVLVVRLLRPEFEGPFSHLCEDLVEATRRADSNKAFAAVLLARLTRWNRLMELTRKTLSEEELRGLVGELVFMSTIAIPMYGAQVAVHGWTGPLKAPQDFELPGAFVEVKTVRPGAPSVVISSVEQLDAGEATLALAVVELSKEGAGRDNVVSLGGLIDSIRSVIQSDPAASSEFEDRLLDAKYSDIAEQAGLLFRCYGLRLFSVKEGFPRLVRAAVPRAVLTVKYEVEIKACEKFEIYNLSDVVNNGRS